MKRRHFIHLGLAGLAGCRNARAKSVAKMPVCPFSVTIPEKWRETAIIEKVPLFPLYSVEGWQDYQKDELNVMKPGYSNRPQHWAIRLPAALPEGISYNHENADDNPIAPQILIHKADEWGIAFTDGEHEEVGIAKIIRAMREEMNAALDEDNPNLSPGYINASLQFMRLKRRLDFNGGHGIRLLAQGAIESDLMRLGDLHYLFLGMSDDNSVQIIATFPVSLPGLPDHDEKSHLGRSTENYPEFCKIFADYHDASVKWLEKHADEVTPSLQELDGIVQSLVAPSWKDS